MFKSIAKRYKEGQAVWDNKDGFVKPVIPYWLFLALLSTPVAFLAFMVYQVATR